MRNRTVLIALAAAALGLFPGTVSADQPVIASMLPTSSGAQGGILVVIAGGGFAQGATVRFGSVLSPNVTVAGSTMLIVTVPPGVAGTSHLVLVTNPDGTAVVVPTPFSYNAGPLTATSLSPQTGSAVGGTLVTISGAGFLPGATVSFGGAPGTSVSVVSSTVLTVIAPAGVLGSSVNVGVTNPDGGTIIVNGLYAFGVSNTTTSSGVQPTISSVSPNNGSAAGGTLVTIQGSGFLPGASVSFGTGTAASVSVANSTRLSVTTPSGVVGPVSVTVTNPTGVFGGLAGGFTYLVATPQVTSVSPTDGVLAGGTPITISGSGFVVGASVTIGGQLAKSVSVTSGTLITAVTPAGVPGASTLLVTNPGGLISGLSGGFTYSATAAPPIPTTNGIAVTSVSPASGPSGIPTIVTITGQGFLVGAIVTIGGVPATNVTVISPTVILASVPTSPPAGAALVVVSNAGGAGAALPGGFTYTSGTSTPPTTPPSTFPAGSSGLFVFSGGNNQALVAATGCPATRVVVWATNAQGQWVGYIPTAPAVINLTWDALFPNGLAAGTAVFVKCTP